MDTQRKLRILVIDDKEKNLEAARQQLGDRYELVLSNIPVLDWYRGFEGIDVVLTDMLMPTSSFRISEVAPGQETPYGLLVLWAAIRAGVKYVGLIPGGDPHVDPISAVFGDIETYETLKLGEVRVVLVEQIDTKNWRHDHTVKNWGVVLSKLLTG